jgi:hypothetical protein
MLESLSISDYQPRGGDNVRVQVISRKDHARPERGILRDFTPDELGESSKIKSDLHGDMQRLAEMTGPHAACVEQQQ